MGKLNKPKNKVMALSNKKSINKQLIHMEKLINSLNIIVIDKL